MNIPIGFSPCPNDTFIFDALVNNKIDTEGIHFLPVLEDVQTLNEWAIQGKLPVTKISYGVLPLVTSQYKVLNSGSALGNGVGPLLITKNKQNDAALALETIAIPGENTTAHLLFSLAYPNHKNKIFLRYDQIEEYVQSGNGPGVIIHENRFTYAEKGLHKIIDLGDFWEQQIKAPIPLGGIVVSKNIDKSIQLKIDRLIQKSIEIAHTNWPQLNDYICNHSQEMSEDVMRKHIELYVNDYSKNLGPTGHKAVLRLMDVYGQLKNISINREDVFV
ncbi:MAG: 1,4-dihydroxy-6-naphthoate synthase [Niastella sp.]|nr:1,4-dihydroxy-6-naphthoate synthase [Niastella sp.]